METLADLARTFGLELDADRLHRFEIYYRELIEWNARMNLTSITDREQVIVKHFLDSLSVAPVVASSVPLPNTAPGVTLVDVGSGAGFPGIPLKLALPGLQLTLLEATRKKVDFLTHLIQKLGLTDSVAIQARAEDAGRDPARREQYDIAVARAVADLAVLAEYALPLVRVGGLFIAQKGVDIDAELQGAGRALRVLGGRLREVVPVQLPGLEQRHLIVVEKTAPTPAAYPRRAGLAVHNPIRA